MPVKNCSEDGKSGYRWGDTGKCYTHDGTDAGKRRAKKLAVKQAIAIGGGKMPSDGTKKHAADTRLVADMLETRDLTDVEIAAADVRVYGTGAVDPGGETYTVEKLEEIAAASNEATDLVAPVKIGHSEEQELLRASGLVDDQDQPAAGHLHNFRVKGETLICDVAKMPRKLADLVETGAFRFRSPEIGPWLSQATDKAYAETVRGLALLGTTPPAFQTLDDIAAVYSADEQHQTRRVAELLAASESSSPSDGRVKAPRFYAAGDVLWQPEDGYQELLDDVRAALNPGDSYRYWVMDVSRDATRAIVQESGSGVTWIVPISEDADGAVSVAPAPQWTMAEQAWVESAENAIATYAARIPEGNSSSADTRSRDMDPETKKLTPGETPDDGGSNGGDGDTGDEFTPDDRGILKSIATMFKKDDDGAPDLTKLEPAVVKTFAAAAGVPDETDPAKILAAIEEKKSKADAPVTPDGDARLPDGYVLFAADEKKRLEEMASAGVRAEQALKDEQRDAKLREYVRLGKLTPAEIDDQLKKDYAANPDLVIRMLDQRPIDETIVRTYGQDADVNAELLDPNGMTEESYAAYCAAVGIPYIGELNKVETKGAEAS